MRYPGKLTCAAYHIVDDRSAPRRDVPCRDTPRYEWLREQLLQLSLQRSRLHARVLPLVLCGSTFALIPRATHKQINTCVSPIFVSFERTSTRNRSPTPTPSLPRLLSTSAFHDSPFSLCAVHYRPSGQVEFAPSTCPGGSVPPISQVSHPHLQRIPFSDRDSTSIRASTYYA